MHSTILRRMTGQRTEKADENPLTSSRALRLALSKAADDTVGLVLTVTSIAEDVQQLDAMLGDLDDTLMLIELTRGKTLVGIAALDMQLRAAILEMQTVGSLIGAAADDRPATVTDKMMCEPMLQEFLRALPQALTGTDYEGWVDDIQIGQRLGSTRAAGLVLDDRDYRTLRMTVDLGVADRTGAILLCVPPVPLVMPAPLEVVPDADWDSRFRANVADAPATLDALLHRFTMPLSQARHLKVGQVVALPGCTVHSVRLLTPDGYKVAEAKLGQFGGKRAVRIESAPVPQMAELPGARAAGGLEPGIAIDDALTIGTGDGMEADLTDAMSFGDTDDLMGDAGFPMMDDSALSLADDS